MNVYIWNKLRCILLNTDHIHRPRNLRCHVIIRGFQTWLRIRRCIEYDAQPVISDGHVSSSFCKPHICTIYQFFCSVMADVTGLAHLMKKHPTACPKVRCLRSATLSVYMPLRHMRKWKYSSTHSLTRHKEGVVGFTHCLFYNDGTASLGHWTASGVSSWGGWGTVEERKIPSPFHLNTKADTSSENLWVIPASNRKFPKFQWRPQPRAVKPI